MSRTSVAANYAATLLELGAREGLQESYGDWLAELATLYREEPDVRRFIETPRISLADKRRVVRGALESRCDPTFLRFLLVTLEKRRLGLLPEISLAFEGLLDRKLDRVRASVTLAIEPDEELRRLIGTALTRLLGSEVILTLRKDEKILGGLVARVEDRVMDGSLRRRFRDLRRSMIQAPARPAAAPASLDV